MYIYSLHTTGISGQQTTTKYHIYPGSSAFQRKGKGERIRSLLWSSCVHAIVCQICSANQKSKHRQKSAHTWLNIFLFSNLADWWSSRYGSEWSKTCTCVPFYTAKQFRGKNLRCSPQNSVFKPEASTGVRLQMHLALANSGTNTCSEGYIG